MTNLNEMKVPELRAMVKEMKIEMVGAWKATKAQLIEVIEANQVVEEVVETVEVEKDELTKLVAPVTVKEALFFNTLRELTKYYEDDFSDVTVSEMAETLKISVASARGILGSLVKKQYLTTWHSDSYDISTGERSVYDLLLVLPEYKYTELIVDHKANVVDAPEIVEESIETTKVKPVRKSSKRVRLMNAEGEVFEEFLNQAAAGKYVVDQNICNIGWLKRSLKTGERFYQPNGKVSKSQNSKYIGQGWYAVYVD